MQHVQRRAPELAVHIGVDVVHRPWSVQGDQRGDLFDGAATELAECVAHALAF